MRTVGAIRPTTAMLRVCLPNRYVQPALFVDKAQAGTTTGVMDMTPYHPESSSPLALLLSCARR